MENVAFIKKDLKKNLSEFRYQHSVRVAEEAKRLARIYHLDEKKAYIAGLVHDVAHEFSLEENRYWVEKYALSKELLTTSYPAVIHAEIGAVVIKDRYQLDDEISQAVRYHTLGNISMTDFDKIVFLADKTARKTKDKKLEKVRLLSEQDLDQAVILFLTMQKESFDVRKMDYHPAAVALLNYLLKKKY